MDREQIKKLLLENICQVVFIKVSDRTERTMVCTLKEDILPSTTANHSDVKKERKTNDSVMPVYDIEKQAWRSFKIDSVKEITAIR